MKKMILFFMVLGILSMTVTAQDVRKPRILLYHDMEGLSGEDDWRMFSFSHPVQYERGRQLLTDDVNAVIDGLFRGGAGSVKIVDGHGSGNPNPDLLLDKLDKRATMVERSASFRIYVDLVEADVYDAIVCVGMHAKTGSGGFASHTFTLGMDIIFNDMSVTETELVAYSWGRVGVPVIFVSGDDKLAGDLKAMPWIEFVTVKKATSASTAELRPLTETRKELSERAAKSISNIGNATVMKLKEPVKASLRVVPPASLDRLTNFPGIEYSNNMATFTAENFAKAYDGVLAFLSVATSGYIDVTNEVIGKEPNGKTIRQKISDARYMRWLDYESGRWKPEPSKPSPPRKYFGAQ